MSAAEAEAGGVPLAERQGGFAAAVLDAGAPIPPGLVGPDGKPSARRFAVYRNNVIVGLSESMKITFPAVARIVGEEFFLAMARAYVVADPPRSPMLLEYGDGFPDFVERFPPAADASLSRRRGADRERLEGGLPCARGRAASRRGACRDTAGAASPTFASACIPRFASSRRAIRR